MNNGEQVDLEADPLLRIRKALAVVAPERLVAAPDCGTRYLSRDLAFSKLEAMVAGARLVQEDLVPQRRTHAD